MSVSCQYPPATGAIAACTLLEKCKKKNGEKSRLIKKEKEIVLIALHILSCKAPSQPGQHISLVICVPLT